MEKICWACLTKTEEVLHTVKEERNALHTIKRGKYNCIGHIFCRNCLLTNYRRKDRRNGKKRKKK